ncbi:hypothetical protein HZH66_007793 [Vespula vulgaris]|uniref:Uncharacterized protein n=1 Tax=Vespula vulgaris TaxID=7454 RepID=A0A834JX91_VESVU|nr:hypothetical protein HZH66_007793 [Vespula vulgaris]
MMTTTTKTTTTTTTTTTTKTKTTKTKTKTKTTDVDENKEEDDKEQSPDAVPASHVDTGYPAQPRKKSNLKWLYVCYPKVCYPISPPLSSLSPFFPVVCCGTFLPRLERNRTGMAFSRTI